MKDCTREKIIFFDNCDTSCPILQQTFYRRHLHLDHVALLQQMRSNPVFSLQKQTYIQMFYEDWLSIDPAESPACRSKQKILIYTRLAKEAQSNILLW